MLIRRRILLALHVCVALVFLAAPVGAQTIEDGAMVARGELLTANAYTYDRWNEYWEGGLKRTNDNIGRLTTRTNTWWANYGVSDKLNLIGSVPYVWTEASQGVLHGIQGLQDLTVAAKYTLVDASTGAGALRLFAVAAAGIPMTDYNPELLPLSIGMASKRVSSRGTLTFHSRPGWFATGSAAHTWRSDVQLDRPYFYTNDEFVMSDQVDMPRVFDYVASVGWMRPRVMLAGFYTQQRTLGGGDIRRQDMPFVSNRMNFSRIGGMLMYPVLGGLEVQAAVVRTLDGRNVGQATTVTGGLMYRFNRVEP